MGRNSQLEESEVGVAVVCAIFTLLRHVVLEYRRRFGIVAVESIQDRIDMFGPIGRMVE